jgi:hypothetical protein
LIFCLPIGILLICINWKWGERKIKTKGEIAEESRYEDILAKYILWGFLIFVGIMILFAILYSLFGVV